MPAGLLTAAERSMIENHKRVNETGQAMNEATAGVSLSPRFPGYELLYHDKRQDRCKWHIYIPRRQRGTWLNLDESSRGCVFYARSGGQGGRTVTDWWSGRCLFGCAVKNVSACEARANKKAKLSFFMAMWGSTPLWLPTWSLLPLLLLLLRIVFDNDMMHD